MTTHSELITIADAAAERAVTRMLLQLGIESNDPIAAQGDMTIVRRLVRDPDLALDLAHAKRSRRFVESGVARVFVSLFGVTYAAFTGMAMLGARTWFNSHSGG